MISLILLSASLASVSAGFLDHSSAYGYATAPAVDLTYGYGSPAYGTPAYGTPAYGSPAYGTPTYGTAVYGTSVYGTPSYGSPTYGAAPIVKAFTPTATSYSNTYHIAKSVPVPAVPAVATVPAVSAAPIYAKTPLAAYGAATYGASAYGVPTYGSPATAYGPSYPSTYGHGYYGSGYGYLH